MSRVEAIMVALLAKLTATPAMSSVAATSIYRDLDSAIASGFPALVLEEGNEAAPGLSVVSKAARELEFRLHVLIKGSAPYSLADAPLIEAYDRLMADRTLGGLAQEIVEGETTRERTILEKPVAIVTKNFTVRFRTAETSLL